MSSCPVQSGGGSLFFKNNTNTMTIETMMSFCPVQSSGGRLKEECNLYFLAKMMSTWRVRKFQAYLLKIIQIQSCLIQIDIALTIESMMSSCPVQSGGRLKEECNLCGRQLVRCHERLRAITLSLAIVVIIITSIITTIIIISTINNSMQKK